MKTVKLAHKHSSKLRTDYEEVDTKLTESRVKYNAAEEEGDAQDGGDASELNLL